MSKPLNIAEGHTRESTKEYLNHLSIAHGSLAEVDTCLMLAERFGWIPAGLSKELLDHCFELGRMLYALRNSLHSAMEKRGKPASRSSSG